MKHSFWLANKTASVQLKAAYKDCMMSNSTKMAVERVTIAMRLLSYKVDFHTELQAAISASLASGSSVDDVLRKREIDLMGQIETVAKERQLFEGFCFSRRVELQPILNQCATEIVQLHSELEQLDLRIRTFEQQRIAEKIKYEVAGLSAVQIDAIGISPSYADLDDWRRSIPAKRARIETITQFHLSAPEFDLSILESI